MTPTPRRRSVLPTDPAAFAGEARAVISRSALLHNAAVLRRAAGGARLCGVVKADAYGHGAGLVAEALTALAVGEGPAEPAAGMLAVATFDEAAALQEVHAEILVLRPVANTFAGRNRRLLAEALRRGNVVSVLDGAGADDAARAAESVGGRAKVCAALDTGMTREGAPPAAFAALVAQIRRDPRLVLHSVSTHLAVGELADEPFTAAQIEAFDEATRDLPDGVLRHASNSGGVFTCPAGRFDVVRPGIALYGVDPAGRPHPDRPLRPVMKVLAPVAYVRDLPAGATVGYGRTWTAARPTRLGLLPLGYADGFPRLAGPHAVVRVGPNQFAPIVGTVSMDYVTIDLTDFPHVNRGDDVMVLDDDPTSPASVYALARHARTIPYEVLCHAGRRLPRVAADPSDADLAVGEAA